MNVYTTVTVFVTVISVTIVQGKIFSVHLHFFKSIKFGFSIHTINLQSFYLPLFLKSFLDEL